MKKLVIATHNPGKLREISFALANIIDTIAIPIEVAAINETGKTFIENAILKARHASEILDYPAVGDDSGLIVPSLNYEPGLYTARYAGLNATNQQNIDQLLSKMDGITNRQAYFYCAMALIKDKDDPHPQIFQGYWYGKILYNPEGTKGFGYDPIFKPDNYDCSAAELDLTIKNQISHRGIAIKQLKKYLQQCL